MSPPDRIPPHARLRELADAVLAVARKAGKHRKPLDGANFYADKLAQLRTDAAVSFSELTRARPEGEAAKLAALVDRCFGPVTDGRTRLQAARDLRHELRISWSAPAPDPTPGEENAVFPLSLLSKRGYLASVGKQMNGCFVRGWYDACGVMLRRLLEIAIIEAFEHKEISDKAKDQRGDFLQLTDLISAALAQDGKSWNLNRATKAALPGLRDVGHRSAHGRSFTRRSDIERVRQGCRDAVEDFLRIADLL